MANLQFLNRLVSLWGFEIVFYVCNKGRQILGLIFPRFFKSGSLTEKFNTLMKAVIHEYISEVVKNLII